MAEKYFFLYVQIILALIGVFAPLLQPKNLLFGVKLSRGLQKQPEVAKFKKSYIQRGIKYFIVWIVGINFLMFKKSIVITEVIWGELVIMFGLYIYYNKFVKKWKIRMVQENPDLKPENPTVYIDTSFRNEKLTLSNKWNMIPGAILLFQLVINILYLDFMLEHLSVFTEVVRYFSLNFVLFLMIYWKNFMIRNAKQQIQASDPETSKSQNIIFRRYWSTYLFIMFTFMIIMNVILNLQALKITSLFDFISNDIYFIAIIVIVSISVLLSFIIGQGGSRIKSNKKSEELPQDDIDDDNHWKLGMIYYNPNDPSFWVDKRMGIGWTINFGNKISWLFLTCLFGIIILSVIFKW